MNLHAAVMLGSLASVQRALFENSLYRQLRACLGDYIAEQTWDRLGGQFDVARRAPLVGPLGRRNR